ncbi:MAG: DUF3307 domain-containing protein [Candidatus Azobacteroides sp.]|nr:DUF3307 domain-containing protein [Candidatus Azobacteroides sp.]
MITLLFLQFTAHLLADFTFQSQKWCNLKENGGFSKIHIYHAMIVFVCSWVLSFSFSFWWAALLITLFHLIVDLMKGYLFEKKTWKNKLFFIDQTLHLAMITGMVYWFSRNQRLDFPFFIPINCIFIIFALIACTKPANIFVRKFIEANDILPMQGNTLLKAGRIIGSLERVISFILIAFNQFAAVGFIITAKSILRYRDPDTAKTEYVLIGSLLSFGIAIFFGIAYQLIL